MYTYQDFQRDFAKSQSDAISTAIKQHLASREYQTAVTADEYDSQQNTTIRSYVKYIYNSLGNRTIDEYSANNRLCSNFFNRLNTQRMTYSLGNGIIIDDKVKDGIDPDFDTKMHTAGYYALIHGVVYIFRNLDKVHVFKVTEFAPLVDESNGALVAGIRFWQIDAKKPMTAVLYESDGYSVYVSEKGKNKFVLSEDKRAYKQIYVSAPADEVPEITGENYNGFPIVPLYGTRLKQSTLVGMRAKIDAYDLIQSGFANDLMDCSEIYWLVSGAGGATEKDMAKFRDKLKLEHIASVPNSGDVGITPYTQEVPYAARKEMLDNLKKSIYEDFGGLDVHEVSASSTNDHLEAAYQPMDENADDYEYQIITAVQALLALDNVFDVVPSFKRNRISNVREQTEVVLMCAPYLSDDMIRAKLPILSSDEVEEENANAINRDIQRFQEPEEEGEE